MPTSSDRSKDPTKRPIYTLEILGALIFAGLCKLLYENPWSKHFFEGLPTKFWLFGIVAFIVLALLVLSAKGRMDDATALIDAAEWRMPTGLRERILRESERTFTPDELRLDLFRAIQIQTTCEWSFHPQAFDRKNKLPIQRGPTRHLPEIFQENLNHRMLLVGNAGAGKTTALSQIGTALVQHAFTKEDAPIPMRFVLSNWSSNKKDLPLAEWLAKELQGRPASLSKEHAQAFVQSDELLPILEGLDEVRPERYESCVREIQTFLKQRSLRRLAISLRSGNEDRLPEFDLPVVKVLDLTAEQVGESLARPEMKSTRELLDESPELREQIRTPLWLEVAYLASKSLMAERRSNEAPTDYLYGRFISYALTHNTNSLYGGEGHKDVIDRNELLQLGWLAERLTRNSHSDFCLADLVRDWLGYQGKVSEAESIWGVIILRMLCLILLFLPVWPLTVYTKAFLGNAVINWQIFIMWVAVFAPGDFAIFRPLPISVRGVFARVNSVLVLIFAEAFLAAMFNLFKNGISSATLLSVSLGISILCGGFFAGLLLKRFDSEALEPSKEQPGFTTVIRQSSTFTCVAYPFVLIFTMTAFVSPIIASIYSNIWESQARFTLRWLLGPLFFLYIFVTTHLFLIPLGLGLTSALWVFFLKNGGLFTAEHWAARLYLALTGKLPLDLENLLHRCCEHLLLVRRGDRVEFFHPTFREYMRRKYGPDKDWEIPYNPRRTPEIIEEFRQEKLRALQEQIPVSVSTSPPATTVYSEDE